MTDERFTCPNCGTKFSLTSSATPCPVCGKKVHRITHHAVSKGYPDMEARGMPPGRGRSAFFQKEEQGYEFFRKTGRWHKRERSIDRRGNRYREHIEDAETGERIRDKDEPLKGPEGHIAERDLCQQGRQDNE
jgi:hypothetical protein